MLVVAVHTYLFILLLSFTQLSVAYQEFVGKKAFLHSRILTVNGRNRMFNTLWFMCDPPPAA